MRTWILAATALCTACNAAHAQQDAQREKFKAFALEQFRAAVTRFSDCAMGEARTLAVNLNENASAIAQLAAQRCDKHLQNWRTASRDIEWNPEQLSRIVDDGLKAMDSYKNKFIEGPLTDVVDLERLKARPKVQ